MARPREFDRGDVLEKAMQVFWTKGYERTSIRELVAAMGINRGSLYDTFGDKQALYQTALERYCTSKVRPMPTGSDGESALGVIRRYFETVANAGPHARKRGCFISNTIAEFSNQGGAISQTARAGVERIETALTRLIAQAQKAGEVRFDRDPRMLARFLTSGLNGLRLIAKTDVTRAELDDIVELMLSTLEQEGRPMAYSNPIVGFHAHVYYDADTKDRAAALRSQIEDRFDMQMGSWHDNPVGPHPFGSYQIAFAPELFGEIVPYLALNRDGLTVFIHPETGDVIPDHTDRAIWLGAQQELNLSALE